jgi:hypothetical protein
MHVAFHFVVQPADVYSQSLGMPVMDAIVGSATCVFVLLSPSHIRVNGQSQLFVRAVLRSHSFGGKSSNGHANGVKQNRAPPCPGFSEDCACPTLLGVVLISV